MSDVFGLTSGLQAQGDADAIREVQTINGAELPPKKAHRSNGSISIRSR
jgi:hypothetical protein